MSLSTWPKVLDTVNNNINLEITGYSSKQTSIQTIINSDARGTLSQVQQLIGSKGYIVGFEGKPCRLPILNTYNEGLSLIHFFVVLFSSRRLINRYSIENCRFWLSHKKTCLINKIVDNKWRWLWYRNRFTD